MTLPSQRPLAPARTQSTDVANANRVSDFFLGGTRPQWMTNAGTPRGLNQPRPLQPQPGNPQCDVQPSQRRSTAILRNEDQASVRTDTGDGISHAILTVPPSPAPTNNVSPTLSLGRVSPVGNSHATAGTTSVNSRELVTSDALPTACQPLSGPPDDRACELPTPDSVLGDQLESGRSEEGATSVLSSPNTPSLPVALGAMSTRKRAVSRSDLTSRDLSSKRVQSVPSQRLAITDGISSDYFESLGQTMETDLAHLGGLENLSPVEMSRWALLRSACGKQDLFYIIIHRLLCDWPHNQQHILQLLRVEAHQAASAFRDLDVLLINNSSLRPKMVRWFALFPADLEHLLETVPDYRQALDKVTLFVANFGQALANATTEVDKRRWPLLVHEIRDQLYCPSPQLQLALFTFSRRRLDLGRGDGGTVDMIFFENQELESQLLAGRVSTERYERDRYEIVAKYLLKLDTQASMIQIQQPRVPTSYEDPSSSRGSHVFDNVISTDHQGTSYPAIASQASIPRHGGEETHSITHSNWSANSSVLPPDEPNFNRQGYSQPLAAGTSAIFAQPAQGPHAQALIEAHTAVDSRYATPQAPPAPNHTAYLGAPFTRQGVQNLQRTVTMPDQHGAVDPSNGQMRDLNRIPRTGSQPYVFSAQEATRLPNFRQSWPSQWNSSSQQHLGGVVTVQPQIYGVPGGNRALGVTPPRRGRPPGSGYRQQARAAVMPIAPAPPPAEEVRPASQRMISFIQPQDYPSAADDWTSLRVGLHLFRERSPIREPANASSKRYYQFLSGLVVRAQVLRPASGCFRVEFEIPESGFRALAVTDFQNGLQRCRYTESSQRLRLRLCKLTNEEDSLPTASILSTKPTYWPQEIYLSLNNKPLQPRRKQHYRHDLPIELTELVKAGHNTLVISYPPVSFGAPVTDVLGVMVEVVSISSGETIRQEVLEREKLSSETKAELRRRLTASPDDDEIVVQDNFLNISLADPFSSQMCALPVRSIHCKHVECFDLDNWLESRQPKRSKRVGEPSQVDVWKCPICAVDARPQTLRIDDFFQDIRDTLLAKGQGRTKTIRVDKDISWKAVEESDDSEDETPVLLRSEGRNSRRHSMTGATVIVLDD